MARDKGYGSGKPLTANASRTRARVAAGRFTKGKKRAVDNLVISKKGGGNAALRKIAKDNPVTGFIGGGVALGTLSKVAAGLSRAGRVTQSLSVADRAYAKATGQELGRSIAISRKEPMGAYNRSTSSQGIENLKEFRLLSRDVFPKRPGPGKQPGATLRAAARKKVLSSGGTIVSRVRGTVNPEGFAAMQKLRAPGTPQAKISKEIARNKTAAKRLSEGEKYRQSLGGKSTRVGELEKRLNLPKRGR